MKQDFQNSMKLINMSVNLEKMLLIRNNVLIKIISDENVKN